MSIIATAVRHLMAAGVTGEALIDAIADMEASQPKDAAAERRRAWDRERKRKAKADASGGIPVESAENAELPPFDKKGPHTPKKIKTLSPPISPPKRVSVPDKPEDVSESTWADWLDLRKRKRAPVTAGVIDGARQEAAKLGWTLEKTLATWVFRGSQGFQAEWITGSARAPPGEPISLADHILAKQKATAP